MQRVIFLGASNLARGFATVVATARELCGSPLEVFAALGHGRSYGQRSTFLGRSLPGIAECELWDEIARRPAAPTRALVTDVGNDILYGVPVDRIAGWVEACLDRLGRAEAQIILTPLPIFALVRLGPWRFGLLRTLFYPRCRLSLKHVAECGLRLDERLRALARARGAALAEPRAEWYGFDPIHLRTSRRRHAWREILSAWAPGAAGPPAPGPPPALALYLRTLPPKRRWWFGLLQRRAQPAGRLRDGTTVWMY